MRIRNQAWSALLTLALAACTAAGVKAQSTEPLQLDVVRGGHGKVRLTVTAGADGAPTGFQVCWMPASQFEQMGSRWTWPWVPGEGWVDYTGLGTLNTWGEADVDFRLAPGQSLDIEVGDTRGESGVTGTIGGELDEGTDYVFVAVAHGAGMGVAGPLSLDAHCGTSHQGEDCTYTIGYWKNHTPAWPAGSLTLGSVNYSASQLQSILAQPVAGNGLISLAHQLIAAKLNVANGANPSPASAAIAAADALIGGLIVPPVGTGSLKPSRTSSLTQDLDEFNNGEDHSGHCGSTPTRTSTWGMLKLRAR